MNVILKWYKSRQWFLGYA